MCITSKTNLLGVIGNPVRHSLSPLIHNFVSERLGLDYVYMAFEPDNLADALCAVKSLGIRGVNITAPYKYEAFKLVDIISDSAKEAGSINTVVNNNGVLTGYSTDGEGLFRSMQNEEISIADKKVLVVGAGGASEPICVMLHNHGVTSVNILNRTHERAVALTDKLNTKLKTNIFKVADLNNTFDVIINTTSVGMGTDESPISNLSVFDRAEAAVDIIYYPRKTRFLQTAEDVGLKTMNGLGMLVGQGLLSYEYFTGVSVPDSMFREVFKYINE